jgi:hypothetical protein
VVNLLFKLGKDLEVTGYIPPARPQIKAKLEKAGAASCTFFSAAIPLKAACGEEKMYREVEKVEEGTWG